MRSRRRQCSRGRRYLDDAISTEALVDSMQNPDNGYARERWRVMA